MDDTSIYTRLYLLADLLIDNFNFIKDISRNVSEESNSQTGLKENIPGSEQVALGKTLSSHKSDDGSILQESDMSLINLFKSSKNKDESVAGSRTIPSILTSTVGLIDTSGNSVLQDTIA